MKLKNLLAEAPINYPPNNWLRMHHKPMVSKKERRKKELEIFNWYVKNAPKFVEAYFKENDVNTEFWQILFLTTVVLGNENTILSRHNN